MNNALFIQTPTMRQEYLLEDFLEIWIENCSQSVWNKVIILRKNSYHAEVMILFFFLGEGN